MSLPLRVSWRKSLATQLSWVSVCMVVLALVAVGVGLILIARQAQRESSFGLQEKSADEVALLISSYVSHAIDGLSLLERTGPLAALHSSGKKVLLEDLLIHRQSLYGQFTVLDRDGNERIKVSRFYTYLPGELRNQARSESFIKAMEGEIYVSPVHVSPESGLLSVQIAMPMKGRTHEILGVLLADVNVSRLWQGVSRIRMGQTGYSYLVDVNGRFAAYQEPATVLQRYGEDMRGMPPVAEFMAHGEDARRRVHEYAGLTGEPVIGVYAPIRGTDWAVIAEWPTREAYVSLVRMQWYLCGLMIVSVVVAACLGFAVSRRLVLPMGELTSAAQRIGAGDLDTEIKAISKENEVGILARSFRQMQEELKGLYRGLEQKVDELERVQSALRHSEEHYRNIFENAVMGIFQSTPEGRFMNVNPALSLMYGYESPQAFIDCVRNIAEQLYVSPDDRLKFERTISEKGIVEAFETEQYRKDGGRIWISINARLVRDGGGAVLYYEGTVENITKRKEAEGELLAAHQRLSDIIEFLPDATFVIDRHGSVLAWNRACEEMTGVAKEKIIGRGDHVYSVPFFGEKKAMLIDDVIEPRENRTDGVNLSMEKDHVFSEEFHSPPLNQGKGAFLAGVASPLFDNRGQIVGAIESIRDITELKRLQSQLLQSQKMESIGTLAGGIAHDFNNLLMGIQGYASLLKVGLDSTHPHQEMLKSIESQVASGAALARQLLGFARGGQYDVSLSDLNEIIAQTSATFGRTRKEVVIHEKLQPGIWTVAVDRVQMEQVLLNLYINAWEAMPQGGDLSVETENVVLHEGDPAFHAGAPGRYVKFAVRDTGTGMDEKIRERVFDPFFTTKEMGRGIGLGLASTYGIIRSHGGVIEVQSELGHGTTFSVYLPASEGRVEQECKTVEELIKGMETILIVDDEETVIGVTKEMLDVLGYRVLAARNGPEALSVYEENQGQIALVILDMIMPGMGGAEVFTSMRGMNPRVRVILSSGYSMDARAREILSAGCEGFIQKPFSLGVLSEKVREVLDRPGS